MKKQLFLVMLALASLQMFALEIEEGKFYTIRNHSSTPAYMADNNGASKYAVYWYRSLCLETEKANVVLVRKYSKGI